MKMIPSLFYWVVLLGLAVSCSDKKEITAPDVGVEYKEILVTPAGGTYQIDNNCTIRFPAGAVSSDITLSVAALTETSSIIPLSEYEGDGINLFKGFAISPKGQHFIRPISVKFTSLQNATPFIPIIHSVDLDLNTHQIAKYTALVDFENDSMTISISNSGSYITETNFSWQNVSKPDVESCRDKFIYVESKDKNIACSDQNCQVLESSILVKFLSCPGEPQETAIFRETTSGCAPKLTLTPANTTMATNSSNSINALVRLGCMELESQNIFFSITGLGSISPTSLKSNESGIAMTVLTSQSEEGLAHIEAEAEIRYPVREIIIDGDIIEGYYRTESVNAKTEVTIKKLPIYHISLDLLLKNATNKLWSYFFIDYVNYSAQIEADFAIDTSNYDVLTNMDIFGSQSLGEITVINNKPNTQESVTVINTNAPSSFPCRIIGYVHEDGMVYFFVSDINDSNFATWDIEITYKYDLGDPSTITPFISSFFRSDEDSPSLSFGFPKNKQSYSTSGAMKTGAWYYGTYILSINLVNQ